MNHCWDEYGWMMEKGGVSWVEFECERLANFHCSVASLIILRGTVRNVGLKAEGMEYTLAEDWTWMNGARNLT